MNKLKQLIIDVENAFKGKKITISPGAKKVLEENGLWTDQADKYMEVKTIEEI